MLPAEDLAGSSQGNTGSTLMVNTVLVSDCSSTALQPTLDTFPRQKTALTSNTGATPTVEEAKPDVSTPSNNITFLQRSQTSLWPHGDQVLKNTSLPRKMDLVLS